MTIAVCPGSYDPVTAGHLDVIERSARFFDEVHVVVAVNAAKTPMFSEATRVDVIRRALDKAGCKNVTVSSTDGLITDYCKKVGATVIIKGLRQNGDYEAELGMALVNRKLAGIETLFLPADPILEHISSSIVKDVARPMPWPRNVSGRTDALMTMSDDHPTGYVDLTKPNADAASSTPEPSAPEPPASSRAYPYSGTNAGQSAGPSSSADPGTGSDRSGRRHSSLVHERNARPARNHGRRPGHGQEPRGIHHGV